MPRENFEEGQIRTRVGALEHVVKIPDRLMRVNQENELEFPHRLTSLAALQDNLIPRNCTDGEMRPVEPSVQRQMAARVALVPANCAKRSWSRAVAASMDASGAPEGA
jgi:hypothetical protein